MEVGTCLLQKIYAYKYLITIVSYYVYYIFECSSYNYSSCSAPKPQKPNMSPFKCIQILLFAIPCLTANNNNADLFESEYNIIFNINSIISCMLQDFTLRHHLKSGLNDV